MQIYSCYVIIIIFVLAHVNISYSTQFLPLYVGMQGMERYATLICTST